MKISSLSLPLLAALLPLLASAQPVTHEYKRFVPTLVVSSPTTAPNPTPNPPPTLPPAPTATYLASVSTSQLSFGATVLGQSQFKDVLLQSVGTGALSLQAPAVTGAGFSASTSCDGSLPAGQACSIRVWFQPQTVGAVTGKLSLVSNASNSPLEVQLSAEGVADNTPRTIVDQAGVRQYSDGTSATSCRAYLTGSTLYPYAGATGSGVYRVQPSGQSAENVYCDMTTSGGGWTLVLKGVRKTVDGDVWAFATGNLNASNLLSPTYSGSSAKFSDAFINALKTTGSVYRLEGVSSLMTVPTRYASGDCVYNQAPESYTTFGNTTRPGCGTTYSDTALSQNARTYSSGSGSGSFGGISDNRSAEPTLTFATSRSSGLATYKDAYFVGTGSQNWYESSHGLYKDGSVSAKTGGAGSDLRMWVR